MLYAFAVLADTEDQDYSEQHDCTRASTMARSRRKRCACAFLVKRMYRIYSNGRGGYYYFQVRRGAASIRGRLQFKGGVYYARVGKRARAAQRSRQWRAKRTKCSA